MRRRRIYGRIPLNPPPPRGPSGFTAVALLLAVMSIAGLYAQCNHEPMSDEQRREKGSRPCRDGNC